MIFKNLRGEAGKNCLEYRRPRPRVPEPSTSADLSLICRDQDSYLNYLIERPRFYQYEARTFALKTRSVIQ
jgi:hypothetical protein